MSKITVIGAGNGGMAMAYSLGKSGHEVCIYDSPKFPAQVNAVKEQGGIEAVAELNDAPMLNAGFAKITLATTDIKEAMEFADIVMMVCPSDSARPTAAVSASSRNFAPKFGSSDRNFCENALAMKLSSASHLSR